MTTAWVTRSSEFGHPVIKADVEIYGERKLAVWKTGGYSTATFERSDYALSEQEAQEQFERNKADRIRGLQAQIDETAALTFVVRDDTTGSGS